MKHAKKNPLIPSILIVALLMPIQACFSRIEGEVTAFGPGAGMSQITIDRAGVPEVVQIFFEDMGRRIDGTVSVMPGKRTLTVCFSFDPKHSELAGGGLIDVMGLPTQFGQVNRLQISGNIKYGKIYKVSLMFSHYTRGDGKNVFKFDDVRIVEE